MGGRGIRSRSYTGFARGALHGGISESCEPGVAICRSGGDFPSAVLGIAVFARHMTVWLFWAESVSPGTGAAHVCLWPRSSAFVFQ